MSLLKQDFNYDNDQKVFIANAISDYLFNQTIYMKTVTEYNSIIPDIVSLIFTYYSLEFNICEILNIS